MTDSDSFFYLILDYSITNTFYTKHYKSTHVYSCCETNNIWNIKLMHKNIWIINRLHNHIYNKLSNKRRKDRQLWLRRKSRCPVIVEWMVRLLASPIMCQSVLGQHSKPWITAPERLFQLHHSFPSGVWMCVMMCATGCMRSSANSLSAGKIKQCHINADHLLLFIPAACWSPVITAFNELYQLLSLPWPQGHMGSTDCMFVDFLHQKTLLHKSEEVRGTKRLGWALQ